MAEDRENGANGFSWRMNNVPIEINAQGDLNRVMQNILPQLEQRLMNQAQGNTQLQEDEPWLPVLTPQGHSNIGNVEEHEQPRGHRHGHSHAHHHGNAHTQQNTQHQDDASFVINIGGDENQSQDGQAVFDVNQNTNNAPAGAQLQTVPALKSLWKSMQETIPFLILFFAKTMYNHRLGILIFGAMFGTFYHANSSLKKHITQREHNSWTDICGHLLWIITFLSANIFFTYYVFEDQELYKSLYMTLPSVVHMDVWNLLWIVGVTDFTLKFGTIIIKALIAMLPKLVLPCKKKGKYYLLVEKLSQLYRSVVPITPWVIFLLDDQHGGQWFSIILVIVYTVAKGRHLWQKLKELRKAHAKFQIDLTYGTVPDRSLLQACDNSCPICHDKLADPVMLTCKHIFCEECVSMWFDRERTCPMCRANIVDNPVWRDGTTCGNLQLY